MKYLKEFENKKYFKKGDYITDYEGDDIFKIISVDYIMSDVRYKLQNILTSEIIVIYHNINIYELSKKDVDIFLLKKDIQKYNL
jgi:hypothetical protein